MPLPKEYLHGVDTQRVPRNFSTRPTVPCVSSVRYVKWTAPAAASITSFVTTSAGPNTATSRFVRAGGGVFPTVDNVGISGTAFGGALASGQPDCPRNVVVTVTHVSSVVALSGVIYGADEYGRLISEAWAVTATGTTKTATGKKAFARVDGVTVVAAGNASANTVKIGTGSVLGLPSRNAVAGVDAAVMETLDGVPLRTGTLTAASTASTADAQGTFLPATIPDAAKNFEVWYLEVDPQL